jgi:O-antigen ligase
MTDRSGAVKAGLIGPVSLCAAALLLLAAPLMRGGNRHIALIALEALGLLFLVGLCSRLESAGLLRWSNRADSTAQWLLLLSPAILAVIHLTPIPYDLWAVLPGRGVYHEALHNAGVPTPRWLALSVVPDATLTSLLAGIPLVAAFVAGRGASMQQLRLLSGLVVLMAFAQVLFGLMQISGGAQSPLYFGAMSGRPIGSFANSNHYANYLAAALILYVWLAWDGLGAGLRVAVDRQHPRYSSFRALWVAGGLLLVLGILVSQSRGAAITGLPIAAIGVGWLLVSRRDRKYGARGIAIVLVAVVIGLAALVGLDAVLARFTASELTSSASFRTTLTQSTLAGAAEFWPWGAGWGVYGAVYPRFQPPEIPGAAGYAHQDYAQMLFEGGIFALVLAAAFAWLAVRRAIHLVRVITRKRQVRRETIAAALCGLGLLGFLLHSLVEFNMHIPANAILASLLAGVYLRPLADTADAE